MLAACVDDIEERRATHDTTKTCALTMRVARSTIRDTVGNGCSRVPLVVDRTQSSVSFCGVTCDARQNRSNQDTWALR